MMATVVHGKVKTFSDNPHFLLTNKNGDYLALGNPNTSNYHGLYIRDEKRQYWKTFWNIVPETPTDEIVVSETVTRSGEGWSQEFSLTEKGLRIDASGNHTLTVDCKRLYDESDDGRNYSINIRQGKDEEKGNLSSVTVVEVEYSKGDYSLNTVIATTMHVERKDNWHEAPYEYDDRRGTSNTRWVYDILSLSGKGAIAIVSGNEKMGLQSRALQLLISKLEPAHVEKLDDPGAMLAYKAFDALHTKDGIMAGLPWFFHYWSRDELIAVQGLLSTHQYEETIAILDRWYDTVRDDGGLAAIFPDEGIESTDAPGWLGKRTSDLISSLREHDRLDMLPKEKLATWRDITGKMLDRASKLMRDGLVWTETNTTWMDTRWNDDGRAGACIEIQALTLAICDAHATLCAITEEQILPERRTLCHDIVQAVHQKMVFDGRLLDRLHQDGNPDHTVRPNIFIAWYISPKLFVKEEWRGFFHSALPELWLEWGGLSSISQNSGIYQSRYTGEDVRSYHRGDSWYWVNNTAALAMHSVDPEGFRVPIKRVISAGLTDLLSLGFMGHCSEISSAEEQEAAGCWSQAWSASTLLELLLATRK
ncbi:hypothetical protein GOV11_03795 [Candidatus Woesearchaeota archaeon]|nr:hypothetical protein [Candidatus Woesearchaeota archaeon]